MSVISGKIIGTLGESIGIDELPVETSNALASDVEYRVREIIQEAWKFSKHSNRTKMTAEDITSALKLRKVESLYGYFSSSRVKFRKVEADQNFGGGADRDLYYIQDESINISKFLEEVEFPPCPRDVSLESHWLAVDGVVPDIAENISVDRNSSSGGDDDKIASGNGNEKVPDSTSLDSVLVQPFVKEVFTKEQQLYYTSVCSGTLGSSEEKFEVILNVIRTDPSIQPMVAYFSHFISREVFKNNTKLPILFRLMKLCRTLILNEHLFLDCYIHQLLPAVLTCLVGKKLCSDPNENHYLLRDYCSELITLFCRDFGEKYVSVEPRIAKTLLHAFLDSTKPWTTHYGAIMGLNSLGPELVGQLIIPNVQNYYGNLALALEECPPDNTILKHEILQCRTALLFACGKYLNYVLSPAIGTTPSTNNPPNIIKENISVHYRILFEIFGEELLIYLPKVDDTLSSL